MNDTAKPRKMAAKYLLTAFAAAGCLLAISALLAFAKNAGVVTEAFSERVIQMIIGLGFAAYANFMPKRLHMFGASLSIRAATWMQSVLRVGGWAMTLAGLTYAALWAFAPLDFADIAAKFVILAGTAIMVGYTAVTLMNCRRAGRAEG